MSTEGQRAARLGRNVQWFRYPTCPSAPKLSGARAQDYTPGHNHPSAAPAPPGPMQPTFVDRISVSPEVLFQEVGGEAVLLDLKSESYFGLDDVGMRIWQLIQEHGSLRAVFDRMLSEYDVEPTLLQEDLLMHVGELAAAGLVNVGVGDAA